MEALVIICNRVSQTKHLGSDFSQGLNWLEGGLLSSLPSARECAWLVSAEIFNSELHNDDTNAQEIILCKEKTKPKSLWKDTPWFSPSESQALIDREVLLLIMETMLSLPWFDWNGLSYSPLTPHTLPPALFFSTASVVPMSWSTLRNPVCSCLSPVSSIALAVCKKTVLACRYPCLWEMLCKVSHSE